MANLMINCRCSANQLPSYVTMDVDVEKAPAVSPTKFIYFGQKCTHQADYSQTLDRVETFWFSPGSAWHSQPSPIFPHLKRVYCASLEGSILEFILSHKSSLEKVIVRKDCRESEKVVQKLRAELPSCLVVLYDLQERRDAWLKFVKRSSGTVQVFYDACHCHPESVYLYRLDELIERIALTAQEELPQ
jgi:hypothetical protein